MAKKEYVAEVDDRGFLKHLSDLKKSYQRTLDQWQKKRKEKEQLLVEMKELKLDTSELEHEITIITGMISDINYCINWLHTGKRPGPTRGIERRSVYQNTVLVDPHVLQNYAKGYESRSSSTITEEQRTAIKSALAKLSPREREIFILVKGRGFSSDYVAEMLELAKGTVDEMLQRAQKKFNSEIQMVLF